MSRSEMLRIYSKNLQCNVLSMNQPTIYQFAFKLPLLFSESLSVFGKEKGRDVGDIHNPRRCHWAEVCRPARPQMRLSAKRDCKSVLATAKQKSVFISKISAIRVPITSSCASMKSKAYAIRPLTKPAKHRCILVYRNTPQSS